VFHQLNILWLRVVDLVVCWVVAVVLAVIEQTPVSQLHQAQRILSQSVPAVRQ
jgi:hypothetical protein